MSTEPPPTRRPSGVVTGLLVAGVVGLWLSFWGELLIAVPMVKRTYDEYGMALPSLTREVFELGLLVAKNSLLVLPTVLCGAVLSGALIGAFRHRPGWVRMTTLAAALLLATLAALNVVVVGALAQPALELRKGLNK